MTEAERAIRPFIDEIDGMIRSKRYFVWIGYDDHDARNQLYDLHTEVSRRLKERGLDPKTGQPTKLKEDKNGYKDSL